MRMILLAIAAFGILWILVVPRPGEHGSTSPERRIAHQHGLRSAQLALSLHDEIAPRLVEIETFRVLAYMEAESVAEAERIARSNIRDERQFILDEIDLYRMLLD